jgi:hypothetical protein
MLPREVGMSQSERVTLFIIGFLALYGALVVGVVRWARARLFARVKLAADALAARGAKILALRPSAGFGQPAEADFVLGGRQARFDVRRFGRDFVLLSVRVDSPELPAIFIRPEGATDKIGKAMGLNREVQLGDAPFDDAAYIESVAPDEVVKKVLGDADLRGRVLEILRLGYRVDMSPAGLRATRVQFGLDAFDATPVPAVMEALDAMLPRLPKLAPSEITAPRAQRFSAPVFASFVFSAVAFIAMMATLGVTHPPVDDPNSFRAFGYGLLVWVVVVVAMARLLRGRARSLVETAASSAALLLGVPALTATVLFVVNSRGAQPAPTTHVTRVVSLHAKDHEIRCVPWDPTRTWQKVGSNAAVFRTLKVGDAIEVTVHPGAIGWPWVSDVRRAP